MKPLLIQGGRIISPAQAVDEIGSILIENGRIAWQGRGETVPWWLSYDVLPVRGLIICPGFIDLHCHLREPGFEEKETIASGTRAAARGGFTTVCCMPNTNPPLDSRVMLDYIKSKAALDGAVRVLPIACITRGRKGQELAPLAELAGEGAIGFSDDGSPVPDSWLMRQALETALPLGLPVIEHCEDTALAGNGVINQGTVAACLGLPGIPAAAEENAVARNLALAEETGGWVHIAHVSTKGSAELIRRAKAKGVHVTAEVTPNHLTLTEEAVLAHGANAKVNPPLRTPEDIDALISALDKGVIDIIVTDHAPHTALEKQASMSAAPFGISVLETAFGSLMGLVHRGRITLNTLISRMTADPSRIISGRCPGLGKLSPDTPADIVILDPEKTWTVDTRTFASKGKNTPLVGAVLRGRVVATFAGGKPVYQDPSLATGPEDLVMPA